MLIAAVYKNLDIIQNNLNDKKQRNYKYCIFLLMQECNTQM